MLTFLRHKPAKCVQAPQLLPVVTHNPVTTLPPNTASNNNNQQVFNGTTQDVEFTIEMSQVQDWIDDVHKIIRMDLHENGKAK